MIAPLVLLGSALSCQLGSEQLGTLPQQIRSVMTLEHSYGAPSGDLYRLATPIAALGYSAQQVYIQPGRIALLVDAPLAQVIQRLALTPDVFGPASRAAGDQRAIVAWQQSAQGLAGHTLIGCEYRQAAAANWLE